MEDTKAPKEEEQAPEEDKKEQEEGEKEPEDEEERGPLKIVIHTPEGQVPRVLSRQETSPTDSIQEMPILTRLLKCSDHTELR